MIKARKRFNFQTKCAGEKILAKLYAALVFAFIAATVIVITGLSSDARAITVFVRCIVGFISAGLIVYLLLKILAVNDIFDLDAFIEAKDEETLAEAETEDYSVADETTDEESLTSGEAKPTETGENVQFEPLDSGNLTRMETPK